MVLASMYALMLAFVLVLLGGVGVVVGWYDGVVTWVGSCARDGMYVCISNDVGVCGGGGVAECAGWRWYWLWCVCWC